MYQYIEEKCSLKRDQEGKEPQVLNPVPVLVSVYYKSALFTMIIHCPVHVKLANAQG